MLATHSLILAQAAGGRMFETILFILAIVAVFYFLIIRPQKKKEQQRKDMLGRIQRGDHIVTIGGIYGEVLSIKDKHVILRVDPERDSTLKISRSAVHRVLPQDAGDEEDN